LKNFQCAQKKIEKDEPTSIRSEHISATSSKILCASKHWRQPAASVHTGTVRTGVVFGAVIVGDDIRVGIGVGHRIDEPALSVCTTTNGIAAHTINTQSSTSTTVKRLRRNRRGSRHCVREIQVPQFLLRGVATD
jgi:hypothetical protein